MVKILIGVTGSVAALKLPLLVENLLGIPSVEVNVVTTDHATHFYQMSDVPKNAVIYQDEDEWNSWQKRGDPVLHIELAKWADVLLIAPLDANTLAKLATGICDNLLTCVARAWDIKKPLIFCPAMNTRMYQHPLTSQQIRTLIEWGYLHIPVIEKTLICGDTGPGAMAEVDTIVNFVKTLVGNFIEI